MQVIQMIQVTGDPFIPVTQLIRSDYSVRSFKNERKRHDCSES